MRRRIIRHLSMLKRVYILNIVFVVAFVAAVVLLNFAFFNWPVADDFLLVIWNSVQLGSFFNELSFWLGRGNGPHPVGAFVTIAAVTFRVFGYQFLLIVLYSALALTFSAYAVFRATWKDRPLAEDILFAIACILIAFFPTQAYDILWPFSCSFFLVSAALAGIVWLIEAQPSFWVPLVISVGAVGR